MQRFTAERGDDTVDELWLVEHDPVFTLGLAGRREYLHDTGGIPVVQTERGGQVTYHGPGQVVAYLLLDLRRRGLMVRTLVRRIEAATIGCLDDFGIAATTHDGAPGVYLQDGGAKIASLGLKVSRGCSYHGVALNVAMDLSPFGRIDPCGQAGLEVTDMARSLHPRPAPSLQAAADGLARRLVGQIEGADAPAWMAPAA